MMNKGVGTLPLRSQVSFSICSPTSLSFVLLLLLKQAYNSLELFNCLATSSDHAYLDMHWGLIFIRSQWSFQLGSQLGSAQLMWMP
jgi:hypothetical protein|uniref:Uncharacterized protein n=1 Tax=Populus trichocarpa TaxID=3694 RepID=A0A2K1ZE30_POPTR